MESFQFVLFSTYDCKICLSLPQAEVFAFDVVHPACFDHGFLRSTELAYQFHLNSGLCKAADIFGFMGLYS